MAAEQSSNHSGEPQIGIQHLPEFRKSSYYWFLYFFGDNANYIHWDREYLRTVNTANLQKFLLGGCGTSETLCRFQNFVQGLESNVKRTICAIELESIIFDLRWNRKSGNLARGDLLKTPLANNSVDYIYLDFLQNFVPPEMQRILLIELKRILSPHGIISSVVCSIALDNPVGREYPDKKYFGSRYASEPMAEGNLFCPSEAFTRDVCTKTGFEIEIPHSMTEPHWTGKNTLINHVVMKKKNDAT